MKPDRKHGLRNCGPFFSRTYKDKSEYSVRFAFSKRKFYSVWNAFKPTEKKQLMAKGLFQVLSLPPLSCTNATVSPCDLTFETQISPKSPEPSALQHIRRWSLD
ncbi:hypothetical protein SKAU_G00161710 [Synaphobranchus kaupii]|uniref:Uncharacterized protein n=1 Tax=Synaphobranchus kaupii TaxID=118154 RepID=A0A9Q1FIT4_SYNKA|nr:hypothetical protein SKAU_G00161710 [Synaphobranchus kaupii]